MSEELDEILTRPPGALMQWGITVLACLVMLLLAGAWVIRYPDVIKADIVITTQQPPTRIYSRVAGRISHLLVTDTAMVKAGAVLAEIENTTHLENVPVLKQLNRQIARFLQQPAATVQIPSPMLTFGDLQTDVSQLIEQYQQYQQLIRSPFQAQQTTVLRQQIADYRRLVAVNDEQARINGMEFINVEQKYLADKQLYLEKVYGRLEFLKEENSYLQKKKDNETYRRVAIENGLTLSEREKQLQTLQHDFLEKKQMLANGIRQLISKTENALATWQQNYLIKAPVSGRLSYLKLIGNQDFVRANDTLFSIAQNNQPFVGQTTFGVQGIGKLRVGQRVVIRLDDYPYQQYGLLRGTINSLVPSTNWRQYRAIVSLPDGLRTTQHQDTLRLTARTELTGTAELITDDLRLLERAFYGLRALAKPN
jgi:multidrug efflux pump subunit AcrA (membrane-fusion protein)